MKLLKRFFLWICYFFLGSVLFVFIVGKVVPLPQQYQLESYQGANGERGVAHRQLLDARLVETIIRIEDKRFRIHYGFDPLAWIRAVRLYLDRGAVTGGSTIDQQVVKLLDQAYARSWKQKFHEIFIALLFQSSYTKDEILTSYLNLLPFPYGRQGILAGCQLLYGTDCTSLTQYERFFLIATYQLGTTPYTQKGFDQIQKRAQLLCSWWQDTIDDTILCTGPTIMPLSRDDLYPLPGSTGQDHTSFIQTERNDNIMYNTLLTDKIHTVLSGSEAWRRSVNGRDCCVIAVDRSGNLITQATCRTPDDEDGSYVNGCFEQRQVGSLMKPLVYVYALSTLGKHMNDTIVDEEVSFELPHGGVYRPQNFDLTFHGEVTLAEALASSLNVPAVRLIHDAGVEGYFSFLNRLRALAGEKKDVILTDSQQFNAEQLGLSVALGTYELSPYQAVQVWRLLSPHSISVITNEDETRWRNSLRSLRQEIIDALSDSSYRIHGFSDPRRLTFQGWAIKTGTSRHYVDGWMCGVAGEVLQIDSYQYEPGFTLCVWMGNYEGEPMGAAGADSAGVLWGLVEELFR